MPRLKFANLILYEDEDYIAINKPAFVATLDDRQDPVSIISLARGYIESAQVCHRLDKETSGVLVIAKHPEAYRALSIQFERRKVQKHYHAICDGIHEWEDRVIDLPIYVTGKGTVKIDQRQGKEARSVARTLAAYKKHSLILCKPVTGRMHQVRIHLSAIGAPITGDEQYGGQPLYLSSVKRNYNLKKWEEELPLIRRVALHAQALAFELFGKKSVCIEAPYPKDFAVAVKQLEKYK